MLAPSFGSYARFRSNVHILVDPSTLQTPPQIPALDADTGGVLQALTGPTVKCPVLNCPFRMSPTRCNMQCNDESCSLCHTIDLYTIQGLIEINIKIECCIACTIQHAHRHENQVNMRCFLARNRVGVDNTDPVQQETANFVDGIVTYVRELP